MHYSGILVATTPAATARVAEAVDALPALEVHYAYPDLGRLVIVQETEHLEAQEQGLRLIQQLPDVLYAELVYHRFDDESAAPDQQEDS